MADWLAIEGAYRAGVRSLRDMASEYGVSESGIRKRAKLNGWIQDPTATKRQIVSSRLSGAKGGAQGAHCALEEIQREAGQDVDDMQTGLSVCRKVLRSMEAHASLENLPPGMAKTVMEATERAVNVIRTIRELNTPAPGAPGGAPITIQIALVGSTHGKS